MKWWDWWAAKHLLTMIDLFHRYLSWASRRDWTAHIGKWHQYVWFNHVKAGVKFKFRFSSEDMTVSTSQCINSADVGNAPSIAISHPLPPLHCVNHAKFEHNIGPGSGSGGPPEKVKAQGREDCDATAPAEGDQQKQGAQQKSAVTFQHQSGCHGGPWAMYSCISGICPCSYPDLYFSQFVSSFFSYPHAQMD